MPTDMILPSQGNLKETGWEISTKLTFEQWRDAGQILNQIETAKQWWIGDWWNAGEKHKRGDEACDLWGLDKNSVRTCGVVAKAYPKERRSAQLSFNNHRVIMAIKEPEVRYSFVEWAVKEKAKYSQVQKKIKEYLDEEGWDAVPDQKRRRDALLDGETVLINKTKDTKLLEWAEFNNKAVYIGRGSDWGNPFELPKDGDRDTVCNNYSIYLDMKPSLLVSTKLAELKGKGLVCFCYPERCHGNELINRAG